MVRHALNDNKNKYKYRIPIEKKFLKVFLKRLLFEAPKGIHGIKEF